VPHRSLSAQSSDFQRPPVGQADSIKPIPGVHQKLESKSVRWVQDSELGLGISSSQSKFTPFSTRPYSGRFSCFHLGPRQVDTGGREKRSEVRGRTMRLTRFTATMLLMTAIGQAQTLTTAQARAHDGDNATVCGVIASEHVAAGSRGKPTFIDLDTPFPNPAFTILVSFTVYSSRQLLPNLIQETLGELRPLFAMGCLAGN
jgi:hypothetical protein